MEENGFRMPNFVAHVQAGEALEAVNVLRVEAEQMAILGKSHHHRMEPRGLSFRALLLKPVNVGFGGPQFQRREHLLCVAATFI